MASDSECYPRRSARIKQKSKTTFRGKRTSNDGVFGEKSSEFRENNGILSPENAMGNNPEYASMPYNNVGYPYQEEINQNSGENNGKNLPQFQTSGQNNLFDFEGQNQLGNSVEGTGPPVDTDGRGLFYQPNSGYPQKSPSTDLIHHFNYPNSKNYENVPFVYKRNENEAVTSGRPAQHRVRSNLPGIAQNSENMGIRVQSHQITPEYRQPYQSNGNFNGGLASQTNFNAPPYKVPYQDMGRSAAIETVRGMFNNQTLNDRGSVYPMQRHTPSYDYDYSQSNRGGTYNHEERNYISQEERQNYWENPVRNGFNYRNDESNHTELWFLYGYGYKFSN